jgi:hypothetical protein
MRQGLLFEPIVGYLRPDNGLLASAKFLTSLGWYLSGDNAQLFARNVIAGGSPAYETESRTKRQYRF